MLWSVQGGNNNTYCHDSELNWFNWEQAGQDETGYARFFRCLVNLRSALLSHLHPLHSLQHTAAYTCRSFFLCISQCTFFLSFFLTYMTAFPDTGQPP